MVYKNTERINFADSVPVIDLPNLISVQINSYKEFLQMDVDPADRKDVGLQSLFLETFPIKSYDEDISLDFLYYYFSHPQHDEIASIERGSTYQVMLKGVFRITSPAGINEAEVSLGAIPLMTSRGAFIINGSERVVVSQLHRSSGVFFEKEEQPQKTYIFGFKIIPIRGSWISAEFDAQDLIYVHIGKKKKRRKILATTFLRALGIATNEDILKCFFEVETALLHGEYDVESLLGRVLAKDIVIDKEVLCAAGDRLTTAVLLRAMEMNVRELSVVVGVDETHPIVKMLDRDNAATYEEALKDCFRKIYPNEPATLSNSRAGLIRTFFDPKRYNLGKVGRYKINRKFKKPVDAVALEHTLLSKNDIIDAIKYLVGLKSGDSDYVLDEIDSLVNRRIKTVGELVYAHALMGAVKMGKLAQDRLNMVDLSYSSVTPGKVLAVKVMTNAIKDFFNRSQLSQYMDQTNVLAELTHMRRLSSLGPGGLTRERAGFEVRDVHSSHYGRVCPVETPEGSGIGLITSLSIYSMINALGFIETPYQVVVDQVVTSEVVYMTAEEEWEYYIAQRDKSLKIDKQGMIWSDKCVVRNKGDISVVSSIKVTHIDIVAGQMLSVAASFIPFLEHDDTNRTLMGANMQRQAVAVIKPEPPIVGTGMERAIVRDAGAVVISRVNGVVSYVDGCRIVVTGDDGVSVVYRLRKFNKSNNGTCVNQYPVVKIGARVCIGDVLSNSADIVNGEVSLGKNICVAFMPWFGYNFEDAMIVSDRLSKADTFTSVHLEECEVIARETKLGKEEITRDIPHLSEEILKNLDDEGIVKIGTYVKAGDVIVGKVTPKVESDAVSEERLLRVIFGEKATDVKDSSLIVPVGIEGVVIDVKVFSRKDKFDSGEDDVILDNAQVKAIQSTYKKECDVLLNIRKETLEVLLFSETAPDMLVSRTSGDVFINKGEAISNLHILKILNMTSSDVLDRGIPMYVKVKEILKEYEQNKDKLDCSYKQHLLSIRKGDYYLDTGVIKQVKVYVACKKTLEVGDKMAGRHGNKGVVSYIAMEQDMPFMKDGRPVDMIINTLGVPPRMNIGQVAETHLGWLGMLRGERYLCPAFCGVEESVIWEMLRSMGLADDGKVELYDGKTGAKFESRVLVGCLYMLKLAHLVSDKMHARSVGPYSFITRQPLGGRARKGGQRFGEMEVWAAESYGSAKFLQEMLTVKSDDIEGRSRMYQSIVKGEPILECGEPESWRVVVKELQGLCLDVRVKYEEIPGVGVGAYKSRQV